MRKTTGSQIKSPLIKDLQHHQDGRTKDQETNRLIEMKNMFSNLYKIELLIKIYRQTSFHLFKTKQIKE